MKKAIFLVLGVSVPIIALGAILFRRKKINPENKLIAFMGDSYTAGYQWGWQSDLAKTYKFTEVNLAKGGMRTDWMLQQTRNYLDTNKPDYYFVYGGANDAYSYTTNETALKNIQAIVDTCNSKGVKPIVISGYNARKVQVGNVRQKPSKWQLDNGITQQVLWNYGEKYYQLELMIQGKIKNAIVVPIWDGAEQSDATDGLHLTAAAQKRFAEYVGNYLFKE